MPAVTRSQVKKDTRCSCDRCGDPAEVCPCCDDLYEDEDGFKLCQDCFVEVTKNEKMAQSVKRFIQMEFGVPNSSPLIEEIEDWIFEVIIAPSANEQGARPAPWGGLGCCEWISIVNPTAPRSPARRTMYMYQFLFASVEKMIY